MKKSPYVINLPRVKPCICQRCGGGYIGGRASRYCEKCYRKRPYVRKELEK